MQDMPRPRPPHLHREKTRHGRVVWYVRIGQGPRTRLHAAYGTPEFTAEYQAVLSGNPAPRPGRGRAGSLRWLVERYRDSSAWLGLSLATRRQRDNIFAHILNSAGDEPFADIDRKTIVEGRERRKDRPAAARHFIETMRGLFRWALDASTQKRRSIFSRRRTCPASPRPGSRPGCRGRRTHVRWEISSKPGVRQKASPGRSRRRHWACHSPRFTAGTPAGRRRWIGRFGD